MKLTIRDISQYVKWSEVQRAIKYHYPKDKNNYESLFKKLPKMKRGGKRKVISSQSLEVQGGNDFESKWAEKYASKFLEDLKTGDEEQYYGIHIKDTATEHGSWSMSFVPWGELANMPIDQETIKRFTFADILAHFIWEITFYGNEEQMKKESKELFKRAKQVSKDIKSGEAKNYPKFEPQKGK